MKGEHNRERAIEQLLRETRLDTPASGPCVDAETLAAWTEGTLSPAEARGIEAHASQCDRCQSMLAVFAQAEPGPLVPVVVPPIWQRWRLQWLVPATAMATALAVWVAVPRDRPASPGQAQATAEVGGSAAPGAVTPGKGTVNGAAPYEAPSPAPPPGAGGRQGESAPAQPPQRGREGTPGAGPLGKDASQNAPRREVDGAFASAERRQQDGREAADKQLGTNRSGPPPSQIGPAEIANAAESAAKAERSPAGTDSVQRQFAAPPSTAPSSPPAPVIAPPPQATEADSARPPGQSAPLAMLAGRVGAANGQIAFEVVSSDGRHRWRIDPGGQLEHSSSAGSTWQSAAIAASDVLTAGMSPGGSVCWFVGRNGAVWVTTDGLRVDRRPLPEPVDLMSVRASDARHATVTAANGRTFVTADGGATWGH